jgi:hypothetical protein
MIAELRVLVAEELGDLALHALGQARGRARGRDRDRQRPGADDRGRMKLHSGGTSTMLTEHRPLLRVVVDADVRVRVSPCRR